MGNKADSACASMKGHKMNCCQCTLTAFCEELGLDRNLALKLALGFGGGMGSMGKTCGAVTGAYMVIGLKQNLTERDPDTIRDLSRKLVRDFSSKFISLHGSLECKDLLGCDLSKPGARDIARDKGLLDTVCPQLVRDSVEILENL
jgi:C_GCAxxG_C_C family probable redox protein